MPLFARTIIVHTKKDIDNINPQWSKDWGPKPNKWDKTIWCKNYTVALQPTTVALQPTTVTQQSTTVAQQPTTTSKHSAYLLDMLSH